MTIDEAIKALQKMKRAQAKEIYAHQTGKKDMKKAEKRAGELMLCKHIDSYSYSEFGFDLEADNFHDGQYHHYRVYVNMG